MNEILMMVRDAGVIGLLVVIVWGALNEWWVTGRQYRRMVSERDDYRTELFRVLGVTERATRALDRATQRTESVMTTQLNDDEYVSRLRAQADVRQHEDPSR